MLRIKFVTLYVANGFGATTFYLMYITVTRFYLAIAAIFIPDFGPTVLCFFACAETVKPLARRAAHTSPRYFPPCSATYWKIDQRAKDLPHVIKLVINLMIVSFRLFIKKQLIHLDVQHSCYVLYQTALRLVHRWLLLDPALFGRW